MTDEVKNVSEVEITEPTPGVETVNVETAEVETIDEVTPEVDDEGRKPRFSEMSKCELIDALRKIVDEARATEHHEAQAIKNAYFALRSKETLAELEKHIAEGGNPEEFVSSPDEGEAEVRDLFARFRDIRAAWLEADQKLRQSNLEAKQAILSQIKEIAADIDNVNVNFQKFQDLQKQFKEKADLPDTAVTGLWKEFQTSVELFYDQLKMNKELRDLDFKKNLESKRQLVEQAKALAENPDVVDAINKLMILHNEWRETGPVAKEYREPLWEEFREASSVVRKRHQEFFEGRKATEAANEEAKTKLCEEAETVVASLPETFNAWDEATKKVIDLQAKWKETGFASRKNNAALYNRFRNVCDEFFKAKAEYFHRVKDEYNENLKKKLELCEKAEALAAEEKIGVAIDTVQKLRDEWKKIGSAGRRHSDEVWNRFTTACNAVFDRRKAENGDRRKEENANLEAKKEVISQLQALDLELDRKQLLPLVRELQDKWNAIGHVPFKLKDQLRAEYREICDKIYNSFDAKESRNSMRRFEQKVEDIKDDTSKVKREKDYLLRQLEAKKNDLKTYHNNMGFFNVKSSAGNSMLKDLERKIKQIEQDIEQIQQKIDMLG
ncbi:MAG: DUF349 domain-containing protein [Muribaculaceae bacterium]|nr:DUF349 domain-containing protein [Muribaculaceae bacterium]